jgi:circadian clock protein KaiC
VTTPAPDARLATGIPGLDEVLCGGLPPGRLYTVIGDPGTGKTTLGMQFLMAGAAVGEKGVYISFSETEEELAAMARSHGWTLDGVLVREVPSFDRSLDPGEQYTIFQPAEVELTEATRGLFDVIEESGAARIVIDSLSELRLLSQDPLRFRRQMAALKQYFVGRHATVLLLDTDITDADQHPHTLVHGLIRLQQLERQYGATRRQLNVVKLRGITFRTGVHDFVIRRGGVEVFPRLVAAQHRGEFGEGLVPSGLAELDTLLGGGLPRGTSSLLMGPAGAGKSTLATKYAVTAADRGEQVAMYVFDETIRGAWRRAGALGRQLREHNEAGRISLQQIDTAELSPGEFANRVRVAVEQRDVKLVIIDSLNGYLTAMPEERFMSLHLHELLAYLNERGVLTLLMVAQYGVLGAHIESPVDVTYLSDSVILLRYFEAEGSVRQAISVVKKRGGGHERTIREFRIDDEGLRIGQPLTRFHGVLTGTPSYDGPPLARRNHDGTGDDY